MLLQTRGRLTAHRLAGELEVSERTIYRDIEALSTAGVPVFAERGPGGGCSLLESYRTNLTGLTTPEVQALFMLSIPAPLAQLGVSQELKAALLKLSAALPAAQRQKEEWSRQRIYLDSTWWFQEEEAVPFLPVIQQALWSNHLLAMKYRLAFGAEVERVIAPLGLIAKTNVWYLAAQRDDLLRVYRVSHVLDARPLEEVFERPPDFDLVEFWKVWAAHYKDRPEFTVTARIAPHLAPELPRYFGEGIHPALDEASPPDEQGWLTLRLPFESFEAARDRILGLGRAVEVLAPEALRLSVIDFAQQIVAFYTN